MANGFDTVAVWVAEKSPIIVWMIFGTKTRRAFVQSSCRKPGIPKGVNLFPKLRLETPMPPICFFGHRSRPYKQIRTFWMICVAPLAVADPRLTTSHLSNAERCHHCVVKGLCNKHVGYGDGDVI